MIKHPDPEVQFLVEMLEQQRDSAVAQAAALFRQLSEIKEAQNATETRNERQNATGEH